MNRHCFLLLISVLLLVLCVGCEKQEPVITSIYPRIGQMGEVVTIRGENFGDERDETSYVTIAGIAPTSSAYIDWRDGYIALRVPEFGESGLVYVYREGAKSNAAIFSNQAGIPKPMPGDDVGVGPRITAVTPRSGPIGSVVTIQGHNFGASREGSSVLFTWDAEASAAAPAELSGPTQVEVFDSDFGYEFWSEREIRVRVPDGAISGVLEVQTGRGSSRPEFFEVAEKPGTKMYRDKRRYAITYSVDIMAQEASGSNSLYLWVPRPVSSASQRKVELLSRRTDPFVEDYRGAILYRLNDLRPGTRTGLALSYLVEVYTVETTVRPQQIRSSRGSPLETAYTLPSPRVPSDDGRIKAKAAEIVGREQNPYLKAQRIYQWLLREGGIQLEEVSGGAIEALERQETDAYGAALLFCALARASGIPALPVAGVLVDRFPATGRHFWAEFWIEGFGWIPVDPALGAGAASTAFSLHADNAAFYFGNLDNQRITFSRGETTRSPMDPRGRVSTRERDFAMQTLWEEAVGGLESYSSLWSDVTINGVYAQ
ncbi:hypothetical protein FACS189483_05630 [Spirochaetia bacterium]|nr:hypothetical protein FACS189483_05630 [Spirochaetia bacterium]